MSVDAQQFSGTDQYIATDSLKLAVKAARSLQKPLLVKGEPERVKRYLPSKLRKAWDLSCSPGISSRPRKHSKACMNTMLYRVCVIAS